MKTNRTRVALLIALPSLLLAGPLAMTAALRVPAAMVAVVNLEEAIKGLDERAAKDADLRAKIDELEAKLKEVKAQFDSEKANLEFLPEGPERKTAAERVQKLAIQVEFERQFSNRVLTQFEADLLRGLYERINDAIARLAKKNGYTMVLSTDEMVKIPLDANEEQVHGTVSRRRMLYVDPAHDVTQELVRMMNNEFGANAQPGAGAAPPK